MCASCAARDPGGTEATLSQTSQDSPSKGDSSQWQHEVTSFLLPLCLIGYLFCFTHLHSHLIFLSSKKVIKVHESMCAPSVYHALSKYLSLIIYI